MSALQVWRLRGRGVYLQLSPENLIKLPNSEFTFKQTIDGAVSKGVQRKDIGPKTGRTKGKLDTAWNAPWIRCVAATQFQQGGGVLPVRRNQMTKLERILVPIHFSEPSLKALDEAVELSRPYGAELILMSAVERSYYESPILVPDSGALLEQQARAAEEKLEEICRGLGKRGVNCRTLVEFGVPYQAIVDAAKKVNASLIVMSRHGRTGLAHVLIGSVAERVVQHAGCPILLLRGLPS